MESGEWRGREEGVEVLFVQAILRCYREERYWSRSWKARVPAGGLGRRVSGGLGEIGGIVMRDN